MMLFVRPSFFDTLSSVFLLYVTRVQHVDKSLSKTSRKVIVLYDFKRRQHNLIIILPGQSNRIEFEPNILRGNIVLTRYSSITFLKHWYRVAHD